MNSAAKYPRLLRAAAAAAAVLTLSIVAYARFQSAQTPNDEAGTVVSLVGSPHPTDASLGSAGDKRRASASETPAELPVLRSLAAANSPTNSVTSPKRATPAPPQGLRTSSDTKLDAPRSSASSTVEHPSADGESTGAGPEEPASTTNEQTPSDTYTWQDGNRVLLVFLEPNPAVHPDTGTASDARDNVDPENAAAARGDAQASEFDKAQAGVSAPVFRSESGEIMTLPGGIALILDPAWGLADTERFFARHAIDASRVTELDYVTNGYFVETEPGFPSLNLANLLASQDGVELSSPNWLIEIFTE